MSSLLVTTSWVVVSIETGKAVIETFSFAVANKINRKKYRVVSTLAWLQSLNDKTT